MSVQRIVDQRGVVRYKARVYFQGRQILARRFDRRSDAIAWEQDQARRLRQGDWVDPRRGYVSLDVVAQSWLLTREGVKRRTRENDTFVWRRYIEPTLGTSPIAAITTAQVSEWAAQLVGRGLSPSTARRALATLRAILNHAVSDQRLVRNPAIAAAAPKGAPAREGQALSVEEVAALADACTGRYGELVVVLAYTGLRWGEVAGLQVRDIVDIPSVGLRLQRAVLAGRGPRHLFVDTLKNHQARTVPLTGRPREIVRRWSGDRKPDEWIFPSTAGTPLSEGNWKRMVRWSEAKRAIGRPTLRVHDLRHTAASIWLGAGADAKVVQRVLGHASAAMTLDLYGHLTDRNLWQAAERIADHTQTTPSSGHSADPPAQA